MPEPPPPNPNANDPEPGRFAYDGLERLIHEKARLGIMTCLAVNEGGLSFGDLKSLCSLTDGNLSRHLTTLEEAGLIASKRSDTGRRQTRVHLTDLGRQRYMEYLQTLQDVIADAQKAAIDDPPTAGEQRIRPA